MTSARTLGLAIVASAALAGCTLLDDGEPHPLLDPNADHFAGIPRDAVEEIINEPGQENMLEGIPDDENARGLQARALDVDGCRRSYLAYKEWVTTGTAPELDPMVMPTGKETRGYTYMSPEHEERRQALAEGDRERFESLMIGDGLCAMNFPVEPGDWGGKRIDVAMRELGATGDVFSDDPIEGAGDE